MKKIINTVEEKKEVVAVQITREELVNIFATECTKMFEQLSSIGEHSMMDILIPMLFSKFSASIVESIFKEDDKESEDK